MEARVNGIVRQVHREQILKLLTSLSGASPFEIEIHEVVLEQRQKADVTLHRYRVESNDVYDAGVRWTSSHFSKPPWGDKVLDAANASIRLVKEARIPSASGRQSAASSLSVQQWEREGYGVRYHLVKDGVTCDLMSPDGIRLHVLLYRLFRGERPGPGDVARGEALDPPDASVIEVWTHVEDPSAGYEKHVGAIAWLHGLLEKFGVRLVKLADRQKTLRDKRKAAAEAARV